LGISSGANFIAALKIQEKLGPDTVVVTIFPDDNKKYLSTDLMKTEPIKDGFLSVDVDLEYYTSFKRVCATCCDPNDCRDKITFAQIDKDIMNFCPIAK
jgi:cysteine synthase A